MDHGGDIAGTTTPVLSIANVELADKGFYYCVLTLGNDTEQTYTAALETNPMAASGPDSTMAEISGTAQFMIEPSVAASFEWFKAGDPNDPNDPDVLLVNGGDISGADTNVLTIADVDGHDIGAYYCVLTFRNDTEVTELVYLSAASIIAADPVNTVGYEGREVELTVISPLADYFQWYKVDAADPNQDILLVNGGDISGADTDTLTIENLKAADEGHYYCVVGSSTYFVTNISESARLTIKQRIAYWKFEENLVDELAGWTGKFYNSSNKETTPLPYVDYIDDVNEMVDGHAVQFLRFSKYIRVNGSFDGFGFFKNGFTFSAWIRVTPEESAENSDSDFTIIAKQNTAVPYKGFRLAAPKGSVYLLIRDTKADAHKAACRINTHDGKWHLITGTFEGKYIRVYVDGVLGAETSIGSRTIAGLTTEPLVIGAMNKNGAQDFNGLIDEVKAYEFALNPEEVAYEFLKEDVYPDVTPPTIDCPPDLDLEYPADTDPNATGWAEAFDIRDGLPMVSYEDAVTGSCPIVITRTWTATDLAGNSTSCVQIITVNDTTPPDFSELTVTPAVLWPPNHKMILVTPAWDVNDIADEEVDVQFKDVLVNEPDNGRGDGNTNDDVQVQPDGTIYLRAERSGRGDGRIYTLIYEAIDDCGNVSERSVTVTVPHDKKMYEALMNPDPEPLDSGSMIELSEQLTTRTDLTDFTVLSENWKNGYGMPDLLMFLDNWLAAE